MRATLQNKASEIGLSLGDLMIETAHDLCQKNRDKVTHFAPKKEYKTNKFYVNLKDEHIAALNKKQKQENVTRAFLVRRIIEEALNLNKRLSRIEINSISDAAREVNHIGTNLNQIARKINSGELQNFNRIDVGYLKRIIEKVSATETLILEQVRNG